MKGVAIISFIMGASILFLLYMAFLNPFGSTNIEAKMTTEVYSMDNALIGGRNFLENGLAYSVYQACHDVTEYVDFMSYSDIEFQDDIESEALYTLKKYTEFPYNFLDAFEVNLPEYHMITVTPIPLPEEGAPNDYNIQLSFDIEGGLAMSSQATSLSHIQNVVERVRENGHSNTEEYALYRTFTEKTSFLDESKVRINGMRVDLEYTTLEKDSMMVATGLITDAISKFTPEFIEENIKEITVLSGLKLKVMGDYVKDGIQYAEKEVNVLRSFSTKDGSIYIDYEYLTQEGPKALYREIANIISHNDFNRQEWLEHSGLNEIIRGDLPPLTFMSLPVSDEFDYYISQDAYSYSRRPFTFANKESLNGPKWDFSEITAIALTGGGELEDLRQISEIENNMGAPFLKNKLDYVLDILNRDLMIVGLINKMRTLFEFRNKGPPFDMIKFYERLESIANQDPTNPEVPYSSLSVIAIAPEKISADRKEGTVNITLERDSEISVERNTPCFQIYFMAQEKYNSISDFIQQTLDSEIEKLPKGFEGGVDAATNDNACELLYNSMHGKTIEETRQEFIDSVQNTIQSSGLFTAPDGYALDYDIETNELDVNPELYVLDYSQTPPNANCNYLYHASLMINMTITKPDNAFPVNNGNEIRYEPARIKFPAYYEITTVSGDQADINP